MKQLPWMKSVRERLAQHLQNGSFERVLSVERPHRRSTLDSYFSVTRDNVARHAPYPIIPSVLLKPNHAFAARHPDGRPILIHRATDGESSSSGESSVHAFLNVCRHRGAQLLPESSSSQECPFHTKRTSLLVCPYHAWSYRAKDGALQAIPGKQKAFPSLDQSQYGLEPVSCFESVGFIWVGGDEKNQATRVSYEETHTDLQPLLILQPQTDEKNHDALVGYKEWRLAANWQLIVETFLESYHVKALHQSTLHKVAHSSIMVTDMRDDNHNFRMTVPLKNFDSINDDMTTPSVESFLGQTTTTTLLFPSTAISLFKRFAVFLSIEPVDSESSKVRAWGTDHALYHGKDREVQRRDFESVVEAIEEDWGCTERMQSNLSYAETYTYGQYEGCNVKFLQNVDAAAEEERV